MESGWVRVPKNTLDPPDKYPIIGVGVVTDCKEGLILRFTPQCAYLRYTLLRGPSPGAPSTTTRFSHAYSICVRRSCGALAGLAVQTCAICMAGAGPPRSQPAGCEGGGIQGPPCLLCLAMPGHYSRACAILLGCCTIMLAGLAAHGHPRLARTDAT